MRDRRTVRQLRVVLMLEAGTVPCGRLIAAGDEGVAFAGWIELAAALERVLVEEPEGARRAAELPDAGSPE